MSDLKNKVKDHWNSNPMDYDNIDVKQFSKEYYRQINQQFYKICYFGHKKGEPMFSKIVNYSSLKGKKVLEIGCGAGTMSTEFAKHGAIVTAIDLTETAIKNTKNQFKFANVKGKIMQADAENLPFKDESFDYVWSWGVIHHTPDTRKCSSEIYRVLKKGGRAQVMLYHKNSIFNYLLVIGIRGILQGKLFKHGSKKLLNMYTDHSHIGGVPLAKCYSKKEVRNNLFKEFNKFNFKVYGVKNEVFFIPLFRKYLHKLPNSIPSFFLEKLGLGWYLLINMKK